MIERSVRKDEVPRRAKYDVQKIATTPTEINTASDLITTITTIASCVSSLPP
jgi:hypothetical protein